MLGVWPPSPAQCTLVGRFTILANGTLAQTSRNPDGTPFISLSTRVSAGVYNLTLSGNWSATRITATKPTVSLTLAPAQTAKVVFGAFAVQTVQVRAFAADGTTAADGVIYGEIFDN